VFWGRHSQELAIYNSEFEPPEYTSVSNMMYTTKWHPLLQRKYALLKVHIYQRIKYALLKVALQGSIATLVYMLVIHSNNHCKVATHNDGL
jgi:hypothetical protein